MSKELNDVVGVGIEPPFGGLVPFGKRSAFPRAVPSKDQLKKGDALILSFGAQVGGYNVECERSFSIGKPNDYAKRLFDAMLAAHDAGVENMKEGAIAQEVDQKSLDQIRKAGFGRGSSDQLPEQRSEEHTSELQSRSDLVCRLLLE